MSPMPSRPLTFFTTRNAEDASQGIVACMLTASALQEDPMRTAASLIAAPFLGYEIATKILEFTVHPHDGGDASV